MRCWPPTASIHCRRFCPPPWCSAKPWLQPSDVLRLLLRDPGLKPLVSHRCLRPARRAFAVHRLTTWAVGGVDIHARLPVVGLPGHVNVLGTEVYLKATPSVVGTRASASSSTRVDGVGRHESRPGARPVHAGRGVLHRVPSPPTGCQRSHPFALPGCADVAVQVRCWAAWRRRRLLRVNDIDVDSQ